MLKIVPMTDPAEHERVCLKSGIPYDKSQFAYCAYEDENIIGASQFYIKDGIGYLSDIRLLKEGNERLALSMLLGRAVLNFLDLHGVKEAYLEKSGEYYDDAAKVIGFKNKDGKHYAYLEGMFTVHEH